MDILAPFLYVAGLSLQVLIGLKDWQVKPKKLVFFFFFGLVLVIASVVIFVILKVWLAIGISLLFALLLNFVLWPKFNR